MDGRIAVMDNMVRRQPGTHGKPWKSALVSAGIAVVAFLCLQFFVYRSMAVPLAALYSGLPLLGATRSTSLLSSDWYSTLVGAVLSGMVGAFFGWWQGRRWEQRFFELEEHIHALKKDLQGVAADARAVRRELLRLLKEVLRKQKR